MEGDAWKAATRWRYWSSRLAVAVFVPILILAALEGALLLFGVGHSTAFLRSCTSHGRRAFCNNVFFTKPFFPNGMIRAPYPFVVPAEKTPRTFRIFVLGESAAYGDPDPAYGFSRYLEVMLRARFPSVKFEVTNAAATAINSHVILPMARELAGHQPDLFIIYAGNNEVVGPYGPGTALTRPALSLGVIRAGIVVRRTRIGQVISDAMSSKEKPQEWRGMEMFLDKQVSADSPLLSVAYENFAANLHGMIAAGRHAGARVLVSTVVTNLIDCAPFASAHRKDLQPGALESWENLVRRGAQLEDTGSYADALTFYQQAADIDDAYAELQFRMGRSLAKLGKYQAAREHLVKARDLDTLRFRADSRINDTIRSIAAGADSGTELVDAEQLLAEQSAHGISGSELLYEHVHLKPRGNYLLARMLFPRIASKLPPDAGNSGTAVDAPSQAECERMLAFTAYDHARVAAEMVQRLTRPPFANQLNHDEELRNLSLEAQPPSVNFEQTVEEYQWALARNPHDALLHVNFGLLIYDRDRQAAIEQFRMARPYDDIPFEAPDGTLIR